LRELLQAVQHDAGLHACSVGLALGVHLGVSYSGVSVHLAYVSCKAYI
jgi:hypothetical protein